MASFKKLVILALIWVCPLVVAAEEGQSSQEQETAQLLWAQKKIPHTALSEFAKMNENEIVTALRTKYNLKVIILEGKSELKNPNLTIGNLEEDAKLVEYLKAEQKFLGDDPDDAYHLGPYEHVHSKDTSSLGQRPFLDRSIIALPTSATRETIIHEFLHQYLDILAPESPVEIESVLHDSKCAAFLAIQKLEKELKAKQLKFYQWNTPQDQKDILEKEILLLGGQLFLKGLDYFISFYGEEMDVHRFIYEHRKELNLTSREAARAKDRVSGYIGLLLDKLYLELHIMIWTDKFNQSHWKTDSEVKDLYSTQIVGRLEKMQANMDLTNQWLSSQP